MKKLAIRFLATLIVLNFLVCVSACVRTKISPIPQPPTTAKLRIFVLAVTKGRTSWATSQEKFSTEIAEGLNKELKKKGIYEVVPAEDIKAVIENQAIGSREWTVNDWALARDVGRALHADYVFVIERRVDRVHFQFSLDLINLNTGKPFHAFNYISLTFMKLHKFNPEERIRISRAMIRKNYEQIFSDAKKDLLNTAMVKGKFLPEEMPLPESKIAPWDDIPQKPTQTDEAYAKKEDKTLLPARPAPSQKQKETPLLTPEIAPLREKETQKEKSSIEKETLDKPKEIKTLQSPVDSVAKDEAKEIPVLKAATPDKSKEEAPPQPKIIVSSGNIEPVVAAGIKSEEKQKAFEKELEEMIFAKDKKQDGTRLIVYDFNAAERMRIVGLILSEALREELHKLGGFVLINRENMLQVMEEYKLQHSGLIDDKESIKIGQWLAANEAVTGMLASLGAINILQAKRIDIKKMNTIALGSLRCPAGKEDELLDNMPFLARKLVQKQK